MAAFLSGEIRFTEIVRTAERTLAQLDLSDTLSMDEVFARDRLARTQARAVLESSSMVTVS